MHNRVEIKLVVVGEESSGKETFSHMLFLDNNNKIRTHPFLSKLSELYLEIDPGNFPNSTKKIIEECNEQNNLIMKQKEIINVQNLRNNGIEPLLYRYTKKIIDLIDSNEGEKENIDGNIMLNFYFIGNNYLEFTKEINAANIIIFIVDINKSSIDTNEQFHFLVDKIKNSHNKKYLLTLVNKCDTLNVNGEFDQGTPGYDIINHINQYIRQCGNRHDMCQNIFPAIAISCKYAFLYRQIIHYNLNDLTMNDQLFITNNLISKKEDILQDIGYDKLKYLKKSGYISFRNILSNILNTKYKLMVDHNFELDIEHAESELVKLKVAYDDEQLFAYDDEQNIHPVKPKLKKSDDNLIDNIKQLRNKAKILSKILQIDYQSRVIGLSETLLANMLLVRNPNINMIDYLEEAYRDDVNFSLKICATREKICVKITENISKKLYSGQLNSYTFLPSKVYAMFSEIYDSLAVQKSKDKNNFLYQNHVIKLATHICELYSTNARKLLKKNENQIELLFDTYFSELESLKISAMLNEIQSMMKFETYKNYLIQIWLTKIMVADKYIKTLDNEEKNIRTITEYCKSLKYHLSNTNCKKYEYLFANIHDICNSLTLKINISDQLQYISSNINDIINFKMNNLIDLDNFIIKRINKNNYQGLIMDDVDSNADSDDNFTDNIEKNIRLSEDNDDSFSDADSII